MNNNSEMKPEMIAKIFNDDVPIIHRDALRIANFLEVYCVGFDTKATEAVRAAIPLPSVDDIYKHYRSAVEDAVQNAIARNGKPTHYEACQMTDWAMRSFPSTFRWYYESVRSRIIEEIECADIHCPGCGIAVDMRDDIWGEYCSKTCYTGDDRA